MQGNHVATVGVWVKQTAAYFKSVTRENTIRNNVFHDSPRSLVNWNDVILYHTLILNRLCMTNRPTLFANKTRRGFPF